MPGAVVLASIAALRAGAGRLQIATVRTAAPALAVVIPESRVVALRQRVDGELHAAGLRASLPQLKDADAVLIGPGMGPSTKAPSKELLRVARAYAKTATVVLDAGGMLALGRGSRRIGGGAAIVTPHAGEMARLWGVTVQEVRARPFEIAREAALHLGVVVVLKGETTHIASPSGQHFVSTAGNPGLGTSGSGDVLAGVVAGLCARGASAEQAAAWAVHLHAKAGEKLARRVGPLGFLARELLDDLPALMATAGAE